MERTTSTVASTESRIPQLEAQVASSKNQLAVLLGTYNSRVELTLPKASVFEKTPTVPVGLPSELLRRGSTLSPLRRTCTRPWPTWA